MSRFLIVGTGRSASTFCQAVFRVCGVRCTHQSVFTFGNYSSREWDWGDSEGEASFMAVPLLADIKNREPDTTIILVQRQTDMVVRSWLRRGLFHDDMATKYPEFHAVLSDMFPNVLEGISPECRAWRYVQAWNGHAAQYADALFNVETMSLPALFVAAGQTHNYDHVLAHSISRTVNSGPP